MKNLYINSLIVLLLIFISTPVTLKAIGDGPFSGSTFLNSNNAGTTINWNNPQGAAASADNSLATATLPSGNRYTNFLRVTGFNFNIPNGATINGIMVEVRLAGQTANTSDRNIRILKGGNAVGNDLAQTGLAWPTSLAYKSYGSSTNLWGSTWTAAEINATNFGFQISAGKVSQGLVSYPIIDHIRITVFYNENNFYSKATGDLNVLSTWGSNINGTGTQPTSFTTNSQNFHIVNGNPGTIGNNWTVSGTGSKVIVGNGTIAQDFTIPAAFAYSGLVDVTNNATLNIINSQNPTLNILHLGSTVNYGLAGAQLIESHNYYNLELSGSGTKALEISPVVTAVTNEFIINSDVDFDNSGEVLQLLGNLIISGSHIGTGNIWLTGSGTQDISGTNGTLGNITIESSSLSIPAVTLSTPANLTGTLTLNAGTFQVSSNLITDLGSVIEIENGKLSGIPVSTDPYDVIYSDSLTITGDELLGVGLRNVTVDLITIPGTTSTLSLASNVALNGDFVISNGEVIAGSFTTSIGGDFINSGTFTANSSNVVMNGNAGQTITGPSLTQFNNLTISNTTDTIYANSDFDVTNTLIVGSGAVLRLDSQVVINEITRIGTLNGSGTVIVTRSNGVSDYYEQYRFITNTLSNITIEYDGTAQQAIDQPFNFGHVKINNLNGVALTSNTIIEGQLTLTEGDFLIGSNTLTLNGPPIMGDETNFITIPTSNLVFGGTSGSVFIPSGVNVLNNLIINNPNWIDLNGNMAVNGALDLSQNNTILNIGSHTLTLNGPIAGIGNLAGSITSRLIINGTSASNASLNFDNTFNNLQSLVINRPASVITLNDFLEVGDTLRLTDGSLAAGNSLTMGPSSLIMRSGGAISAITLGTNVYDVEYYGNSKSTGDELLGSMLTNILVDLNISETLTLFGNISLLNNLQIDLGIVDVSANNFSITLGGNFINNDIFIARQGSVLFNGTSFQTIGGASNTDFHNINIDNVVGVSLLTDAGIFGTLAFINGNLSIGINDLFVGLNAAFTGISNTNYIITDDNGGVRRIVDQASGEIVFPIGTLDSYNPAYLTQGINGVIDTYKVRVYEEMYDEYTISGEPVGSPYNDFVVRQTWIIDEAVNGGSDLAVALQWNAGDEAATFNNNQSGVGFFYQFWRGSPSFTPANARTFGLSQNRPNLNNFNNTPFGVGGPGSVLPVELLSFEGELYNNQVDLEWITANESNNNYFEVQRSADAIGYETIGEVKGNGTTTSISNYAFTDIDPLYGISYYRLKQVDLNGEFEYSKTIAIENRSTSDITVYPVPANNHINISYGMEELQTEAIHVQLINAIGTVIMEMDVVVTNGVSEIPLDNYPNGTYILLFEVNNEILSKEIIITR